MLYKVLTYNTFSIESDLVSSAVSVWLLFVYFPTFISRRVHVLANERERDDEMDKMWTWTILRCQPDTYCRNWKKSREPVRITTCINEICGSNIIWAEAPNTVTVLSVVLSSRSQRMLAMYVETGLHRLNSEAQTSFRLQLRRWTTHEWMTSKNT